MSKVPASVGPDNWLKAEERLLKLPCVRDVVAYDAQERKPSQTSPAVKGNGHAYISAKAREKVVVHTIVVLAQPSARYVQECRFLGEGIGHSGRILRSR